MFVSYFERENISWVNCTHGVNGRNPTELNSMDIIETCDKIFGKEKILIAVISAHLLTNLEWVAGFNSYKNYPTITHGCIPNEIGTLYNIRFILDTFEVRSNIVNLAVPDGIVYSTYIFEPKIEKGGPFIEIKSEVINLRSTLSY